MSDCLNIIILFFRFCFCCYKYVQYHYYYNYCLFCKYYRQTMVQKSAIDLRKGNVEIKKSSSSKIVITTIIYNLSNNFLMLWESLRERFDRVFFLDAVFFFFFDAFFFFDDAAFFFVVL